MARYGKFIIASLLALAATFTACQQQGGDDDLVALPQKKSNPTRNCRFAYGDEVSWLPQN